MYIYHRQSALRLRRGVKKPTTSPTPFVTVAIVLPWSFANTNIPPCGSLQKPQIRIISRVRYRQLDTVISGLRPVTRIDIIFIDYYSIQHLAQCIVER